MTGELPTTTAQRHHPPVSVESEPVVCVLRSSRAPDSATIDCLPPNLHVVALAVNRHVTREIVAVRPDAMVLDTTTADFDAVRLCRDVLSATGVPVLAFAAPDGDDADMIALLDAGATDVLRIDSAPALLHAHVRAVLRALPPRREPRRLTVGDVVIDLEAHAVFIDEHPVPCSPLVFSLLVVLARAPNTVATRESLLSRVWGVEPGSVDTRRVRVAASLLRRLLGVGPRRPRLETVTRVGYRLAVD